MDANKIPLTPELLALHERLATPPAPTPALLEPLRDLVKLRQAATAGPWEVDEDEERKVRSCEPNHKEYSAFGTIHSTDLVSDYSGQLAHKADAAFIAAAGSFDFGALEAALATARPTAPAATAEAGWLPLYPACKLPAVGERVALLNNYGRAALLAPRWGHLEQCIDGYVWRIYGDSAAWDFANFTHYLPIPARPTTEATIIRHLQA